MPCKPCDIKTANECNVIILAGGDSSRMRFPKAWLKYNDDESFLEHLVNEYKSFGCGEIIVVLNHKFIRGFEPAIKNILKSAVLVKNDKPQLGRMYSLQLAIRKMNKKELTFIHNIDSPDITRSTLQSLLFSNPVGYVRPVYKSIPGHPILITRGVLTNILISDRDIILSDLLHEHDCQDVMVDDKYITQNINTPADYHSFTEAHQHVANLSAYGITS